MSTEIAEDTEGGSPPTPRNHRLLFGVAGGLVLLGALVTALAVGVLVLLLNSTSARRSALPRPAIEVNQPVPDFELETLSGERVRLSELRGQPVWLNFWASWCAPCRAEMPELVSVGERAGDRGVRQLTIATGEGEDTVRGYLKRSGFERLPTALDTEGTAAAAFGVYNMPTHVFIDSEGVVREVTLGTMSAAEMERATARLR